MPEIDIVQMILVAVSALGGTGVGAGSLFYYLRRHLDLQFEERLAAIEDQKSENKTFESVVEAFRAFIENTADGVRERNRIQAELMLDYRKYTAETLAVLVELKNSIGGVESSVATVAKNMSQDHDHQKQALNDLLILHQETNSSLIKFLKMLDELKVTVTEQVGRGSIEHEKIMDLLNKIVIQAKDVGGEPSEKKADPEASAEVIEASQK